MKEESKDVYRELQEHLHQLPTGVPAAKSGVDIRILKYIFFEKEAWVATKLSEIKQTVEEIFEKLKDSGMSIEELQETFNTMANKGGLLVKIREDIKKCAKLLFF